MQSLLLFCSLLFQTLSGMAMNDALHGPPPTSSTKPPMELPWLEKYRPTLIKDIVGNSEAVSRLQVIAEEGNMPNLILSVSKHAQCCLFMLQL